MDNTLNYADILTQVLRKESAIQPRLKTIKIIPVCDKESGQFLIIMTGWEKETWINTNRFNCEGVHLCGYMSTLPLIYHF